MKRIQRGIAIFLLGVTGWRVEGEILPLKKCVIIGAPHTSNWDFFYGMIYKLYYGLNIHFLMKQELFRFPFSRILTWMGGIPVDRSKHDNRVEKLGETIRLSDSFYLAISPEGTRKAVCMWKRGFYHIAKKAEVPIILAYMDYRKKVVGIGPVLNPGADIIADMKDIATFYSTITAKYPDHFCLPEKIY
jgi:1-acyl-sn-glycerol-3-phosphate acyltransferase